MLEGSGEFEKAINREWKFDRVAEAPLLTRKTNRNVQLDPRY